MQHRDAVENDTQRPEMLWHCSGQLQQLQGDQEVIHTSITCEEFGFYPGGNEEPLQDSERECGVKSEFKKDFLQQQRVKMDTQGERGRMGRQGNGSVSRQVQDAGNALSYKCSNQDYL